EVPSAPLSPPVAPAGTPSGSPTGTPADRPTTAPNATGAATLLSDSTRQPVRFVQNVGQWTGGGDFAVLGPGYQVALAPGGATVGVAGGPAAADPGPTTFDVLRVEWVGARADARAAGEGRLASVSHFILGSDPARWHTDVPEFAAVRYADLWDGVDLVYHRAD